MHRTTRSSAYLAGNSGVPAVRRAVERFLRWHRSEHPLPKALPVFLSTGPHIVTSSGRRVVASFAASGPSQSRPCVRLATGDYAELRRLYGRDDALTMILVSLSRQLLRYQGWQRRGHIPDRVSTSKAQDLVGEYARARRRP